MRPGLGPAFASIYGLTMTNPMTILSFAALFVGLGVTGGDAAGAALLTAGVGYALLPATGIVCSTLALGIAVTSLALSRRGVR